MRGDARACWRQGEPVARDASNRRVFLVDDEDDVRNSTALLLRMEGYDVEVFPSAHAFLEGSAPSRGCVITDVRMPGMNGVELIAEMRRQSIPLPVIVLTAYADVPLAVKAMKLSAIDLLMKPFEFDALLAAVETAFHHDKSAELLQSIKDRLATLTSGENEVLCRLLDGMGNKEIAHDLGISVRTTEVHRANIMAKTGARGLAGLIKMVVAADPARLQGLVSVKERNARPAALEASTHAARGADSRAGP